MLPVLTAGQMADLDRYTIETLGLDGKLLMSSAARAVLAAIQRRFPGCQRPVIFAGTGNNGGDGIALAYYAQAAGLAPQLVLCHPQITDPPSLSLDSTYFYRICERAYVPVQFLSNPALAPEVISRTGGDVVVDALFGTGLDRPLQEYHVQLIERLNLSSSPVVAVDCPSGLQCTTGEVLGTAIRACLTVTMGYPKRGFYHPHAAQYLGEVEVAGLGFATLGEASITPEARDCAGLVWEPLRQPRALATHKGDYGRVVVIGGHRRYPGAPRLAAQAALRCGAGLVRLVVPEDIYTVCCDHPAIMVSAHPTDGQGGFRGAPGSELKSHLDWADALVLGPGLGDGAPQLEFARNVLAHRTLPTVVDADALRVLPGLKCNGRWPLIATPHVGELARLAGTMPTLALERWFDLSLELAADHGLFLLAKSNQCLVATPSGELYFPHAGHPALATGGTGDVLSGILGALLGRLCASERDPAQRLAHDDSLLHKHLAEIAVTAVNLHAAAARLGAAELGENGFTAKDLLEYLPNAIKSCNGL
jgi:ADP-dependent NAD(P)H-hydrate dehydratase / NAD(P)H-hydrate epimerase